MGAVVSGLCCMIFYLASNWDSKSRLQPIARDLRRLGHTVTSTWLDEDEAQNFDALTLDQQLAYAHRDFDEIDAAQVLILDTLEQSLTGGREVEVGYALRCFLPIWLVGPRRNIFHSVAIKRYPDWEHLLGLLRRA